MTKKYAPYLLILMISLFQFSCSSSDEDSTTNSWALAPQAGELDPYEENAKLGRGINMGNALEAPNEGDWGFVLRQEYFVSAKNAGFSNVRIPIRWSNHASTISPYTIESAFLNRVKEVVGWGLSAGLRVIINIHHYEEMFENPESELNRFLALWQQIGTEFKDYPPELYFEILNEPHNNMTAEIWNDYLAQAIPVIRETNPGRTLLVGTAEYGGLGALHKLVIPDSEQNVIVTFHYYNPFDFTHQGASWVDNSSEWLGTEWLGTNSEKVAIRNDFQIASNYGSEHHRPIHLGEYGVIESADYQSRVRWYQFATEEAARYGFSMSVWAFTSGFACYDINNSAWYQEIVDALLSNDDNS